MSSPMDVFSHSSDDFNLEVAWGQWWGQECQPWANLKKKMQWFKCRKDFKPLISLFSS
jgi:hypothetical protein